MLDSMFPQTPTASDLNELLATKREWLLDVLNINGPVGSYSEEMTEPFEFED